MFESIPLADRRVTPALFLAPMAGVTNSAFRRLLSDFGGYGALFTEMVSASAFLREKPDQSPFTKRREQEGALVYQFRISGEEDLEGRGGQDHHTAGQGREDQERGFSQRGLHASQYIGCEGIAEDLHRATPRARHHRAGRSNVKGC